MIDPVPKGSVPVAGTGPAVEGGLPRRYLTLLGEAAGALLSADDAAAMVDRLFGLIRDELRLDVFFNYRLDGDTLTLEAHGGLTVEEAASGASLSVGQAVCGCVARDRRPYQVFGVQRSEDDMVAFVRALGIDAYACTPLLHGNDLLGTLGFGRRWAERFDEDELSFLHTISHYVALAKYRLKIEAELRAGIASRERLLGELNHRVRNALQTAVAVVRLGAADLPDPAARSALAGAATRLEVLAAAHRPLYATESPTRIDLAALIVSLIERDDEEDITVHVDRLYALPVEQAAAAALLIHTLLTERGVTDVSTIAVGNDADTAVLSLAVHAGGLGQPQPDLDSKRLVRGLVQQLRATLHRDGGDILTILIPYRTDD